MNSEAKSNDPFYMDVTTWAMLLLLALVWGGSFFFAEIALRALSPVSITLHRVVWAVPVLWLVVRFKGYPLPGDPRIWGAYLVMGVLNNAIPFSLIFWGQTHISSGLASILNATTAPIIAVVTFKMDASPLEIWVCPQKISENGITLFSTPITK